MSYIGTEPAASYTTTTKQTITGTGVATYTLDYDVASEQDIQVFLNNVRQEGGTGKAYTVSDNQITFASNIASTDDLYVLFTGKAIQTLVPPDLSITTGMIKDDAVTAAKVDSTLHLSTIKDSTGTNNAMTIDSTGRVSLPQQIGFLAEGSTSYTGYTSGDTLAYNSVTSNGQYNNGGHYDTSTYKFTCPVAGLYFFYASLYGNAVYSGGIRLQHDDSSDTAIDNHRHYDTDTRGKQVSAVLKCSVGDKVYVMVEDNVSAYLGIYGRFCGYFIG